MNEDIIKAKWTQLRGDIKKKWGSFTNNDLEVVNGSREKLLGLIQEREGLDREKAEKQLKDFEANYRSRAA